VDAGANQYIQKPCTLDALREKIEQLGLLNTKIPDSAGKL
jgi:DNA-binding response OmpR family regulator